MRNGRAFAIVRFAVLVCCIAVSLLATPKPAAAQGQDIFDDVCFDLGLGTGCDVEGFAAILSTTNSSEIDTDVATAIDNPDLMDEGYLAQVDGALFEGNNNFPVDQTEQFDDGSGVAESFMSDPVDLNTFYVLEGDHSLVNFDNCEIDPNCGQAIEVGMTAVAVSTLEPTVTGISPTFGYVGSSGLITVTGQGLIDPFTGTADVSLTPGTGMGQISGVNISLDGVTPDGTTAILSYTIAQNATTGNILINIITTFGSDNGDKTFTIGDPPPIITSVSPGVWQAGTTSLPITISGSGFGTSPTVTVAGTGVSLVSVGSTSDTSISATVSIASNAPNGTATVTVQSNGYNGSGFVPATSGESSTSSYNVGVQAAPGPAPTILLYGTTNVTGQTTSMVSGQQIALSATVSLPPGVTISTQQWSMPQGALVGGYNASTSGGCIVLIQGQSSQQGACTGSPVSTTNSSFAFYWVDSGNLRQITYTYSASNGSTNSATTTFNVDAPSGVSVGPPTGASQIQSSVNILLPIGQTQPIIAEAAPGRVPGINLFASATHLPSGGQYQWVQLISNDVTKIVCSAGPQTTVVVSSSSAPMLDNSYPYGQGFPGTVTTTNVANDGANDSPGSSLPPPFGELARAFAANMYLMWIPPVLTVNGNSCPNGSACTIPVPLGSFQSNWSGDAINTLQQSTTAGVIFWFKNAGVDSNAGFILGQSFPTWNATSTNTTIGCN